LENVNENESLGMICSNDLRFPLYEKMLDLLRLWSVDLDSNSTGRIDSLIEDQMNEISYQLSLIEIGIAVIHMQRSHFHLMETHCQRGLSYARLYEGTEDKKIDLLCNALITFNNLRGFEGNYPDALPFAEEAYNCAAVAYNPVHPKLPGFLIENLSRTGDLCKAELFAQMTLDSLKDPQNVNRATLWQEGIMT
jgi:hypothetical protein